jgi:metal-responsive CopG/Arc/MetJ family transcriptional regulator
MTAKVMVSMPETFLEEIDRRARAEQRSRSGFLREAVRFYLRAQQGAVAPGELPEVQQAVSIQDQLAAIATDTVTDSTDVLRQWRDRR